MKYEQAASLNISMGQGRKDKITSRAIKISEETGIAPNASAVANELIDIGFVVLELFGEDWQDHLAVQSEPLWAKSQQQQLSKILDLIENLQTLPVEQQVQAIQEVREAIEMDTEGMVG